MQAMRRSTFWRRILVPFLLVAWLSGCYKWSANGMSPGQLLDEKRRDRVRVTWRGDQYELELPAIQADSLVGLDSGVRIAIPINEIEKLEARQANSLGTVGLIAGTFVALSGVLLIACLAIEDCPSSG